MINRIYYSMYLLFKYTYIHTYNGCVYILRLHLKCMYTCFLCFCDRVYQRQCNTYLGLQHRSLFLDAKLPRQWKNCPYAPVHWDAQSDLCSLVEVICRHECITVKVPPEFLCLEGGWA